jgi:hypothetical protein
MQTLGGALRLIHTIKQYQAGYDKNSGMGKVDVKSMRNNSTLMDGCRQVRQEIS